MACSHLEASSSAPSASNNCEPKCKTRQARAHTIAQVHATTRTKHTRKSKQVKASRTLVLCRHRARVEKIITWRVSIACKQRLITSGKRACACQGRRACVPREASMRVPTVFGDVRNNLFTGPVEHCSDYQTCHLCTRSQLANSLSAAHTLSASSSRERARRAQDVPMATARHGSACMITSRTVACTPRPRHTHEGRDTLTCCE
jgi:hypothetical protein